MTEVSGTCDARFAPVRDALAQQLERDELGASIVLDIDGQTVVDIWGGWCDSARSRPWERDTITNVWSTTKTVTNLAALMLIDRGELDAYAPVADYWPEFAANGKEAIEVRHILSHTSGVSGWDAPFTVEDMYDWASSTGRLAAQAPWWEPGTASGYHAEQPGAPGRRTGATRHRHPAQAVHRRADRGAARRRLPDRRGRGRLAADRARRASPPLPIDLAMLPPDSPMYKTFTGPVADANHANTAGWRHADMGGLNGHANARSVARIVKALSLGGAVDGIRLLSPETIELIFDQQSHGTDLVLGVPLRFGIGYALPETETVPYVPQGRCCYWGGWGGSVIIADTDRRVTIAYMMNNMAPGIIGSDRSEAYVRAAYACLD